MAITQLGAEFTHRRRVGKISLLVCCLVFAFYGSVSATVVVIDDLSTMTRKSDVIVHAKVSDQRVKEDVEGRILTITTLDVIDGLKGAKAGDVVTVYQVGGELNGRVLRVSGAHSYRVGEELVLFGLHLDDMIVSYGVGLGKFRVIRDKHKVRVVEDFQDLVAVKAGRSGDAILEAPTPREFPTLDGFKNAISEALYASDKIIKKKPIKPKKTHRADVRKTTPAKVNAGVGQ